MKKIKFIALILIFSLLVSFCSCAKPEEKEPQSRSYFEYFDTVCVVFSYADESEESFAQNCSMVEELLEKYHRELDIYYEYSGVNNLRTVNKHAASEPVEVSRELMDFLVWAKQTYSLTGGETNIAMGAVLSLWHDCRSAADDDPAMATIPSYEELFAASEHTSIDALVLDEENLTVSFNDPELKLDVGALGKGYVTSLAAKMLEERGVTSYVLNIGGNIRAIGEKPSGEGWITGITNPDKSSDESFATKIVLKDTSCVTSGNYERYYTVDGVRYHHIIDPDTLMPADYFASVTIMGKDSALADALSTALFCMPYEEGAVLIEDIGGVDALWIYEDGEMKMTDGFRNAP